jgi:hypothetical protein
MGLEEQFRADVAWIVDNLRFDKNVTVSVFETNIRLVGGLLSAHLFASEGFAAVPKQHAERLLQLAVDLAERLLPAFRTKSGIPRREVNLIGEKVRQRVDKISPAECGTFLLEFGVLSRITGRPEFEAAARRAMETVWALRPKEGYLLPYYNYKNKKWDSKWVGIGSGVDSYYEYLVKR